MEAVPENIEELILKERWGVFGKEMRRMQKQMFGIGQDKKNDKDLAHWYLETTAEFAEKLRENFPDYAEYQAYHILINSTCRYERAPKLDFLEPFSVRSFIQNDIKVLNSYPNLSEPFSIKLFVKKCIQKIIKSKKRRLQSKEKKLKMRLV